MKWQGKEIDALSDEELSEAKNKLDEMFTNFQEKRNNPKYAKRMKGQPEAPINPIFQSLQDEVNAEIGKRNA